jgi:hypothetical protein
MRIRGVSIRLVSYRRAAPPSSQANRASPAGVPQGSFGSKGLAVVTAIMQAVEGVVDKIMDAGLNM